MINQYNLLNKKIFCALDTTDLDEAIHLASKLVNIIGGVKLGMEFFAAQGPKGIEKIAKIGIPIFIDVKYYDIPRTVARAIYSMMKLGIHIINVHALGGLEMMKRAADSARESCIKSGLPTPYITAVTILTTMQSYNLTEIGISESIKESVVKLACLAQKASLDGVICSAHENISIRDACGENFKLINPGIRPIWSNPDEQKRIVTPSKAISLKSDIMIIGRPITQSDDPIKTVNRIISDINNH